MSERRVTERPSAAASRPLLPAWEATADVVVVGTGVAGLTAALDHRRRAGCRCC